MNSIKDFASEIFNAGGPITTYTLDDATTDLTNFRADGWEMPEDITAESLHAAMNAVIADYARINAEDAE